jgi:hypothetical protein
MSRACKLIGCMSGFQLIRLSCAHGVIHLAEPKFGVTFQSDLDYCFHMKDPVGLSVNPVLLRIRRASFVSGLDETNVRRLLGDRYRG